MTASRRLTPADVERQAEMLANRVRKNFRHLRKGFERRNVGAFRVYDWDIPEIRAVADWYEGNAVVGAYARTLTDDAPGWLPAMAAAVARGLDLPPEKVRARTRRTRPAEGDRYGKPGKAGARIEVREGDLKFHVNLDDYLDTGLFPDHRETRALVRADAAGRDVLNLYGYTGAFTCAAARGGARATTTVDTSGRYLDWARDNLALNGLDGPAHALERAEARAYVRDARRAGRTWGLCVLDPPSFSDREDLDVQRDHRALVEECLAVLDPGGILYFATNHQRFEPRLDGLGAAETAEITARTTPPDYRRTPHRCWRIVR